jgi:regulator of nucleoside diphosphate kinase
MKGKICITKFDYDRLMSIAAEYQGINEPGSNVQDLVKELKRAKKIDSHSIPSDYVTMNSVFEIKNLGKPETHQFRLVFPDDADMDKHKISVLAPAGKAVLGYRVGDVIKWNVPSGEKYYQITRIIYQPEASGDFHL